LTQSIATVIGPTPPGTGGSEQRGAASNITHDPVTLRRRRIVDAVDAHVNHDHAVAHHIGLEEMGYTHRGDDDVGGARVRREVAAAAVADGHGGVAAPLDGKKRHGATITLRPSTTARRRLTPWQISSSRIPAACRRKRSRPPQEARFRDEIRRHPCPGDGGDAIASMCGARLLENAVTSGPR
jgi:hypothetical protein